MVKKMRIDDRNIEALEGLFQKPSFEVKEEPKKPEIETKTLPDEEEVKEEEKVSQMAEKTATNGKKKGRPKGTKNGEGKSSASGIYSIMFELDKELEDYFKETQWITRKSKKDYLNFLIRKDMIERTGARKNCSNEELQEKWLEYKKKLQDLWNEGQEL